MKTQTNNQLIRYFDYQILIETFLVSAIVAILSIRLYLKLTDYPIIGVGNYHISHMLWGGIFMAIAVLQLLIFIHPHNRYVAAILGGLGFGTFIDELGKFITQDYNYFFQPTFSLIYVVFICIFIYLHIINRKRELHSLEYVANSVELIKDAIIDDLDEHEKRRALSYLNKADQNDPIVTHLSRLFSQIPSTSQARPHAYTQFREMVMKFYGNMIKKQWFRKGIVIFFLGQALLSLIIAGFVLAEKNLSILPAFLFATIFSTSSLGTLHFYSAVASTILVVLGSARIYHSRLQAYLMFKRAILIAIFIGEVFAFSSAPLRAFAMLVFHLVVLTTLNSMIDREKNTVSTQP